MLNFEKTGLYHRAPVGFGPAASPRYVYPPTYPYTREVALTPSVFPRCRQGPDRKPFPGWKENSEMHLTGEQ
jgi:hypothetical protein